MGFGMRQRSVVSFFSVVLIVPLLGAYSPALAGPSCMGRRATLVGTGGPDRLEGTRGSDVIAARGGKDLIIAKGGRDYVCGGGDEDLISGGRGGDRIRGEGGRDTMFGFGGADVLHGGPGRDVLFGGRSPDRLYGALGSDILDGGTHDDKLIDRGGVYQGFWGGPGDDYIAGGLFDAVFFTGAGRGVRVDLHAGTARGEGADEIVGVGTVDGSRFDDVLLGDPSANGLFGGAGNDVLDGRGSPATLETDETIAFADVLGGGRGDDRMIGGEGLTFADFSGGAAVSVDLAAGSAEGQGRDVLTTIQGVFGSRHDDSLRGDDRDNAFVPGEGRDSLDGRLGDDAIAFWYGVTREGVTVDLAAGIATAACCAPDSFAQIESIFGSPGRDTLLGDDGVNRIFGNERADSIAGRAGDDYLDGGGGVDSIDGGEGIDTCLKHEQATGCENDGTSRSATRLDTQVAIGSTLSRRLDGWSRLQHARGAAATTEVIRF